jgi:NCS2 family nucleobase:cation symporter-2
MTPEQRLDPDFVPKLSVALPLSIQHILAMFVSNVTPAIIIAGAAGFGPSNGTSGEVIYMIQTAMLFAGIATLFQTITFGPIGARLPIVQGTSFAFLPVMLPIAAGGGYEAMAILTAGCALGGLFHATLGFFVGRLRFALPPLVTGLVVAMIGLSLVKVGIQYAAGGVPLAGSPEYGSLESWTLAGIVILVTFGFNFFGRGLWRSAAILIGLAAGYLVALMMGRVDFSPMQGAGWISFPEPFHFGFTLSVGAVLGFCLMGVVSAIETIGDVSALTETGAHREATDRELSGATFADGLGTAVAGLFGALPNTSFSQNIAVISMTGIMSRHIVTLGGVILILCGLVPKIGALIITVPIEVLGGGVIIMFGMIAAAAISILSNVNWTQRNMLIFAISLSLGLGLQQEPGALHQLPQMAQVLLTSGLLPATFLAVLLNLVLPDDAAPEVTRL